MKKLQTECWKVSDKRKETGQGRYPEWDYYDAMSDVLAHKPSTQPEVVVDKLADSQVQNTQTEDTDDDLTEAGSSLNTSNTSVNASASHIAGIPRPTGDDVTNTNAEMIPTSQGQKTGDNGSEKVEKASSRKRKKTKGEMTGQNDKHARKE